LRRPKELASENLAEFEMGPLGIGLDGPSPHEVASPEKSDWESSDAERTDMIVTPTNTGSAIAGACVGIFGWSLALKATEVPTVNRVYTVRRREQLLAWANANRGIALLALETLNFTIHGITNADAVIFALGNTAVNIIGLWLYLPLRQRRVHRDSVIAVLRGSCSTRSANATH
jgi:hypothetical protein